MTLRVGQLVGAKYELVEKLGEGGFGAVFRARDQLLGRDVAIKIMRVGAEDRETAMQRFFAEARTTSRLGHPNNVRVFDFGHNDDGQVYLVMEYVVGRPLSRLGAPLDPALVVGVAIQVARALDEAHELGIVHRDLKPDNVMISEVDGQPFARVLDYGIAKLENSATGLTKTGGFIGTAEFAAPEQLRARPVDRRTDIYAFGVMLWSLLAGRALFNGEDAISIAYMQVHEAPEPLRAHARVSPALESAIMRCLEKDPAARFSSMAELIVVLSHTPEAATGAGQTQHLPSGAMVDDTSPEAAAFAETLAEPKAIVASTTEDATSLRPRGVPKARAGLAVAAFIALGVGAAWFVGRSAEPPPPMPDPVASVPAEPSAPPAAQGGDAEDTSEWLTPPAEEARTPVVAAQASEAARAAVTVAQGVAAGAAAAPATATEAPAAEAPRPRAEAERPLRATPPPAPEPAPVVAAPTPVAEAPAAEPEAAPEVEAPSTPPPAEVSRRDRVRQMLGEEAAPEPEPESAESRRERLEGVIGD